MKILSKSVMIGLGLAAVACQSSLDTVYQDYLERLARIFELESVDVAFSPSLAYPRSREWTEINRTASDRKTLSLLDFLSLDNCELRYVIARRNSALGKVASASQRLHYQLDFLYHAPECIATLRAQGETETAAVLNVVMNEKKQLLPSFIWQGSLGEKEFRQLWQAGRNEANYPANTGSELITALEQLNHWVKRWLSGDYASDIRAYEINLSVIRAGDGGALYRALLKQHHYLAQANTIFDNEAALQQTVCRFGHPSAQTEALQNVVVKFWIQGLQRQSVELSRRYFDLMPSLHGLELQLADGEPKAYYRWRQQRDAHLDKWLVAPKTHSLRINKLYQRCGMTVGV